MKFRFPFFQINDFGIIDAIAQMFVQGVQVGLWTSKTLWKFENLENVRPGLWIFLHPNTMR